MEKTNVTAEIEKEIDSVFSILRNEIIDFFKGYLGNETVEAEVKFADEKEYFGAKGFGKVVQLVKMYNSEGNGCVAFGDKEEVFETYRTDDFYYRGEYSLFLMEIGIDSHLRKWMAEALEEGDGE